MVGSKSKYFFIAQNRRKRNAPEKSPKSPGAAATGNKQKSILNFFSKDKKDSATEEPGSSSCKRLKRERKDLEEFRHVGLQSSCSECLPDFSQSSMVSLAKSSSQAVEVSPEKPSTSAAKPTPLEQQVIALKKRYPNLLLFVECGYRYRFFGEDAAIAAKILNISCWQDRMFLTASVPTMNGPGNYIRKLVTSGYKVGIVSQTETAASKKVSSGTSSGPFARDLTAVYTSTTMIGDELSLAVSESMAGDPDKNVKSMIMAVFELEKVTTICAVQPSSGQIILDEFIDDKAKSELNRRLDVINPLEIVIPDEIISDRTRSAINFFKQQTSQSTVREEVLPLKCFTEIQEFTERVLTSPTAPLSQVSFDLTNGMKGCILALHHFLSEFNQQSIFQVSADISKFVELGSHAAMPSSTLRNLEIFDTLTFTLSNKGTLFEALNRCKTRNGSRMLKDWISRPLVDVHEISQRLDAVQFLCQPSGTSIVQTMIHCLRKIPDFEVCLMSTLYLKIKPADFVKMCQGMQHVHQIILKLCSQFEDMPEILKTMCNRLKENFEVPGDHLGLFNLEAVKSERQEEIFRDWSFAPKVIKKQMEIAEIENLFRKHKQDICKALGLMSFEYASVSGFDFLIEVKQTLTSRVPSSWTKISSTKQVARFRTPFIVSNLPKLQYAREALTQECIAAWSTYLEGFNAKFDGLMAAAKSVSQLDCLISLALVSSGSNFCRPQFCEDHRERKISIVNGRNLVLEQILPTDKQYVPNDVSLSQKDGRALVLTGPNMGGKTCYLRQIAYMVVMAQIGCFVPASSAVLPIFDGIYVRLGARDEIFANKSTLLVEMEDASQILKLATSRSLVLIDEIGRGTGTFDGCAIAKAVLKHLVDKIQCLTVFVTHFQQVADMEEASHGHIVNGRMGYAMAHLDDESTNDDSDDDVLFLFKFVPGRATRSFGLNVAKMAKLPMSVIELARHKSEEGEKMSYSKIQQGIAFFVNESIK